MATDLTRLYVPITVKMDPGNPGVRVVSGLATDPTLDSDRQICDPGWLEKAMPAYERWGNIREMHQPIAAGVATSIIKEGDAYYVTSKIIDQGTCAKLDAGVLKGYSIGIAHPQVIRDTKAIGGRIVGGEIIEISLVDRPANPSALIDSVEFAEKMDKVFLLPPEDERLTAVKTHLASLVKGDLDPANADVMNVLQLNELDDAQLALLAADLIRRLMIRELHEGAEPGEGLSYSMGTLSYCYDCLLAYSREEAEEAWSYLAAQLIGRMETGHTVSQATEVVMDNAEQNQPEGKALLAELQKALSRADTATLREAHDMLAEVTKSADMCNDFATKFSSAVAEAANKDAESEDPKVEEPEAVKSEGEEAPELVAGEPVPTVEEIVKRLIEAREAEWTSQLEAATTKVAELEAKLTELGNQPDDTNSPLLQSPPIVKSYLEKQLDGLKERQKSLDYTASNHPDGTMRARALGDLRKVNAQIKEIEGNV